MTIVQFIEINIHKIDEKLVPFLCNGYPSGQTFLFVRINEGNGRKTKSACDVVRASFHKYWICTWLTAILY